MSVQEAIRSQVEYPYHGEQEQQVRHVFFTCSVSGDGKVGEGYRKGSGHVLQDGSGNSLLPNPRFSPASSVDFA